MTQAKIRREYPKLVRLVERQAHSKFKRKPSLIFVDRVRRPKNNCTINWRGKQVDKVTKARIFIPKRMARRDDGLAELMVAHELRENLGFQNGNARAKAHRIAIRNENTYRKKLDIKETTRTLLRRYYKR